MKKQDKQITRHYAVCPHDCPSTCALEVEKIDHRTIGRVHGSKDNTYTDGVICAKVARYAERVHHPQRLRTPLKRVGAKGEGLAAFEPIGWDEALDEVAARFQSITDTYGAEAVWPYFYAGTMGWAQRGAAHRLRHALGYSGQKETICVAISNAGYRAGVGAIRGVDAREIADSELIVVWGGNPVHTQINVMTHIAKARRKGAKLVVVDPYETPTAKQADLHLMLKPGTDGALACAVMHQILADGLEDRDYLEAYSDFDDRMRAHLSTRTPCWAAGITGLSEEQIIAFARLYAETPRSYIRLGYGFSRSRNGASNMHAVTCLPTLVGAWKYQGGGALYSNSELYRDLDRTPLHGLALRDPSVRMLDMSRIGPVLTGDPKDLGDGPPVKALFIQNTNPVVVAPESARVREGFMRDDLFVVVHEQMMTETAAMADIVLPATTFLEHDDIYTASGHTHLQVSKAIIEPFAEARSNHWVVGELARRLGVQDELFEVGALDLVDKALHPGGLPSADEIHQMGGLDCSLAFETAHFLDGFGHADKRFHFYADWRSLGDLDGRLPAMPDHAEIIDEADNACPYRLVTAPARTFLNSSFSETPGSQKKEGRPRLLIHPDAAHTLGVDEGDLVIIGNGAGQIRIHAAPFTGVQPGVVVVEGLWPNSAFVDGVGVNALVSAEPAAPAGGAVFHDTKVWLRRG
ncbi:MAG: molybdopterin oxidoreductase family protein [Oceanospirillales bacterium]|nr:molybdopterin oxidoreductase family protein [Oceanospirillales bacterium]